MIRRIVVASSVCALLLAGLTACATARAGARHDRVGGVFDEEQADRDGDGVPDARDAVTGSAAGGEVEAEESVTISGGRPPPSPARGLFDRGGADKKEAYKRADDEGAPAAPPPPPPPDAAPSTTPAPDKPAPANSKTPEASGPRLVIYKGNLTVMVPAVDVAVEKLSARAKELGGYVENQTGNSGANNATVTMRVPAEKFYDVVNELGAYGQVMQKQISAEDVTKQVFDVELRLETAEKSRARLLDLLKSATKMEEILQIENEVRRLTDEIEGMKGELRFLKDQVSMSTLSVTFYSTAPPPTSTHARTRSRFDWINRVGIEPVLSGF